MPASPFRRFARRVLLASGPVLLVCLAIYQVLVGLTEQWWFDSLGYGAHFQRLLSWRAGAFAAGALIFGLWMGANAQVAWRNAGRRAVPLSFFQADDALRLIPLEDKLHLDRYRRRATVALLMALSGMVGLGFSARSDLFVRAFWSQSSGVRDAASNFDLAFFLFELPFYAFLLRFLLLSLVAALLLVVAIYGYEEAIGPRSDTQFGEKRAPRVSRAAAKHLAILWAMLVVWQGLSCALSVPQGFVSSGNIATRVFDPLDLILGWTSAGIFAFSAPLVALLSGLSIARAPRYRTFLMGLMWMASARIVPAFLPLVVARSPQNRDWSKALSRHIDSTRRAWDLDVTVRNLASGAPFQELKKAETASAPLALWPAVAARSAFNRRLRARGSDLRVERVILQRAGDELFYCGLASPPRPAREVSWRERHERAARGLWLQMKATGAAPDGSPLFLPDTDAPVLVGAPLADGLAGAQATRAPFWTAQSPFEDAIVSDTDEWILARPQSDLEKDVPLFPGVALEPWGVKMALATRFFEPLLARQTDGRDHFVWHRGAAERCRQLAPFLDWRNEEARLVFVPSRGSGAAGALKWIVPGLVWSDDYPDSAAPAAPGTAPPGANYGRYGAAGVVDARSGATTLFLLDENEPFMALYNRAFPGLFALPTTMPGAIRAALRPSPALWNAQALVWARYHDSDPLSWAARKSDYRPLFAWPASDATAPRPLAPAPSGDWNLMAYARPEGQAGSTAPPLSAILGADERAFGASGAKTRFVEWRARAPLSLPEILVGPVILETPGGPAYAPPTLFCVAPRLDARGEAQGLIVTRGSATLQPEKTPGAIRQVQLQWAVQISGVPLSGAKTAPQLPTDAPRKLPSQVPDRWQQAGAAWRDLRLARQKGDWAGVGRAEQRLDAILQSANGTPPKTPPKAPPGTQ